MVRKGQHSSGFWSESGTWSESHWIFTWTDSRFHRWWLIWLANIWPFWSWRNHRSSRSAMGWIKWLTYNRSSQLFQAPFHRFHSPWPGKIQVKSSQIFPINPDLHRSPNISTSPQVEVSGSGKPHRVWQLRSCEGKEGAGFLSRGVTWGWGTTLGKLSGFLFRNTEKSQDQLSQFSVKLRWWHGPWNLWVAWNSRPFSNGSTDQQIIFLGCTEGDQRYDIVGWSSKMKIGRSGDIHF